MNIEGRRGYWTPERTETLKAMWADGYAASQIAVALGDGVTRMGVAGVVHRLGLAKRRDVGASSLMRRKHAAKRDKRTSDVPLPPRLKLAMGSAWEALPGSSPVGLEALSRSGCRWPIGDVKPFLFCNEPSAGGRHYCATHNALSSGRGTESEQNAIKVLRRESAHG